MMAHKTRLEMVWCGLFHCWKCEKHIPLQNAPYCDKCKVLMTGQTKLL